MTLKIDSNLTGLSIAEEASLKTLPGTPVWYALEPNTYSDFGGDLSKISRSPIDPSRQNKKGNIVDLDASGGFNTDKTQNNLLRTLQGFFFADVREQASSGPINPPVPFMLSVSSLNSMGNEVQGMSIDTYFKVNDILQFSGFKESANNGIFSVATASSNSMTLNENIVDESSINLSVNRIEVVGFQFPSDGANFQVTNGIPALQMGIDPSTLNLTEGEWIFIGGDAAENTFSNNVGFARIKSIESDEIIFDDTTFSPQTETGVGKEIRIFFGNVIRNEKNPALIKRRSYQLERTLGEDENGVQSEYLEGAVANQFTLNIPSADKINCDLSFVACNYATRDGSEGVKAGTRVSALGEDAFNTSSDVYRIKMAVIDPSTSNPSDLFGYVTEGSVSIDNGVTPNKAVSVLGAFDTSAGNFNVTGSVEAYFSTVAAVQSLRANADVGFSVICSAKNAGFVFDIPLVGLGGGRLNIEKDQPIKVPLDASGAENAVGYTMMYCNFPYLPNAAMA